MADNLRLQAVGYQTVYRITPMIIFLIFIEVAPKASSCQSSAMPLNKKLKNSPPSLLRLEEYALYNCL